MAKVLYASGGTEVAVAATDRGLAYGDGLFETIRVRGGRAPLARYHLQRLVGGCARLAIRFSSTQAARLLDSALERAAVAGVADGVVKLIVTRGSGGRGYAAAADIEPTELALWSALPATDCRDDKDGIAVCLCRQRLALQPALAGIKHLNRLEQVLARAEWGDDRFAEGLMRDTEGYVVEAVSSNLFRVTPAGECTTPPIDRCGVAGVMRRYIIEELAPACGITVCETRCTLDDLLGAAEVFVCNSVAGIRPVVGIDDHRVAGPGPVTGGLQRALEERIGG